MPSFKGILEKAKSNRISSTVGHRHAPPTNGTIDIVSNHNCFFFKLPGELRNDIYAYMMYQHLPKIRVEYCSSIEDINNSVFSSSIFKVNKQIRTESISLLCATTNLEAVGVTQALVLMESIDESGRNSLRNLSLIVSRKLYTIRALEEARFFKLLKQLTSLKYLTVKYSNEWQAEFDNTDLQDFLQELRQVVQEMQDVEYLELNRS